MYVCVCVCACLYIYIDTHICIHAHASYLMFVFLLLFSYRQNLAVDFIVAELAFESLDKFYEFVSEFTLVYADPERRLIDCKTSTGCLGGW